MTVITVSIRFKLMNRKLGQSFTDEKYFEYGLKVLKN